MLKTRLSSIIDNVAKKNISLRELYRGYFDSPVNTDNAWMEVVVFHMNIPSFGIDRFAVSVYWMCYSVNIMIVFAQDGLVCYHSHDPPRNIKYILMRKYIIIFGCIFSFPLLQKRWLLNTNMLIFTIVIYKIITISDYYDNNTIWLLNIHNIISSIVTFKYSTVTILHNTGTETVLNQLDFYWGIPFFHLFIELQMANLLAGRWTAWFRYGYCASIGCRLCIMRTRVRLWLRFCFGCLFINTITCYVMANY